MATHDFTIINADGKTVREDIQAALQALATNSSNSSDPATTYASQFFANTSTNLMRLRNTGNGVL